MELSPRARERLASIGELSSEEKEKAKYSDELDILLADYFTGRRVRDREFRPSGQPFSIDVHEVFSS